MALHVLLVPDKFKGTLTAAAAAAAMAEGWAQARPDDVLELLPMSDGGDGFGEVMGTALGATARRVATVDSVGQNCQALWWYAAPSRTAVIEAAQINGLANLPKNPPHPFDRDTFGLGAAILAAVEAGAERCSVGIGGSSTNDAGFGMARALGWRFLDAAEQPILRWPDLTRLVRIAASERREWFPKLVVAVDVANPLLGERGCTRIYGPQKGLHAPDWPAAEAALSRLAEVARTTFGRDYAAEPGAGAAGGLGFGFRAFLGARLEPGFDIFADHAGLARRMMGKDLVITGEGAIDASTLMGKGVGQVALWAKQRGLPCVGLAGVVTARDPARGGFTVARGCVELTTSQEAMTNPAHWLTELARLTATDYCAPKT